MSDFLTTRTPDGGTWTCLDRLDDGRVMCQLCFAFCAVPDLNPVEGGVEDVCKPCAAREAEMCARRPQEPA